MASVFWSWGQYIALDAATWYATPSTDGSKLSLAGGWYRFVSLPIFQFLLLSLVFPTRRSGRGFYGTCRAFRCAWFQRIPTASAVSVFSPTPSTRLRCSPSPTARLLAGPLANHVLFAGAALHAVQGRGRGGAWVSCCASCSVRYCCSRHSLRRRNDVGLREYGTLAQRYVREFDTKWLRGAVAPREPLVGSAGRSVARRPCRTFQLWCERCASCRSRDRP